MGRIEGSQCSRACMGKTSVSLCSCCSTAQCLPLKPWLVLGTIRELNNIRNVGTSLSLIFEMQIVQTYKSFGEMKALNIMATSEKQFGVF